MAFQPRIRGRLLWTTGIFLVILLDISTCPSLAIPVNDGMIGGEERQRLCPDGSAFHNETSSCYKLRRQGPCGDLQLFYNLNRVTEYGVCGCIFNEGCNGLVNRVVLPSPDSKQCYWAFSKGPCKSGEWYIFNLKTRKPECQANPCSPENGHGESDSSAILGEPKSETNIFAFPYNGTCYRTYTKGFCPKDNQYVLFKGTNNPYPKCIRVGAVFSCSRSPQTGPVVGMACGPDQKRVGDECTSADQEFE